MLALSFADSNTNTRLLECEVLRPGAKGSPHVDQASRVISLTISAFAIPCPGIRKDLLAHKVSKPFVSYVNQHLQGSEPHHCSAPLMGPTIIFVLWETVL